VGFILRGALIVDGTGAPSFDGDIAVEGAHIVDVGRVSSHSGWAEWDVSGQVVAPGFIDVHTHYDAQVLWDPDLTPSSWHGVTTVVTGNCGFSLAPVRREHHELMLRLLENVEGMPYSTLDQGVAWDFEGFPSYLDVLEGLPLRLNVAAFVGHTAVRYYVMGEAATERAATASEIAAMRSLVANAVRSGAVGFSTSHANGQVGAFGHPVPSKLADLAEVAEVAQGLNDAGRGVIELSRGATFEIDDIGRLADAVGRPVTWASAASGRSGPSPAALLEVERSRHTSSLVWPQITCRPIVTEVTLENPMPLVFGIKAFSEALAVPAADRSTVYRDDGWRQRARATLSPLWENRLAGATILSSDAFDHLSNGPTLAELAAARQQAPLDTLIDLSLEDGLRTRFHIVLMNDDEGEVGALLRDRHCLLGLSDAGAHTTQLCDANFSTYLLGHWVRERGELTLEDAVWRLTGQPAAFLGFTDRGRIGPGCAADLVVFDPETVGCTELERVADQPGGAERVVSRARGISSVWVNGRLSLDGAGLTSVPGAGELLRSTPSLVTAKGT
jgi:N-acyl-D-aspartate/D-glutamate deacylase